MQNGNAPHKLTKWPQIKGISCCAEKLIKSKHNMVEQEGEGDQEGTINARACQRFPQDLEWNFRESFLVFI